MEHLFMAFSGITIAVAYGLFFRATVRGEMQPSRATWTVWFFQDGLMTASALMAGIGPAAVMPVVWWLGATVMMVLCVTHGHGKKDSFSTLDKTCIAFSGIGIVLWAVTGSPMTALVASVGSACIGGIPTVAKAWSKPESEALSGWALMFAATIFSSLAITKWTPESGFLPISIGILQLAIILPLLPNALDRR